MRRGKSKLPLGTILFILILIGAVFVYSSSMFEREMPKIEVYNDGHWNLKKPIKVSIVDDSGMKSYRITLKTSTGESPLQYEQYINPEKSLNLEVKPPRGAYSLKDEIITLVIEATDASRWNFLNGNSIKAEFKFNIDKKRPQTTVLSNSYNSPGCT